MKPISNIKGFIITIEENIDRIRIKIGNICFFERYSAKKGLNPMIKIITPLNRKANSIVEKGNGIIGLTLAKIIISFISSLVESTSIKPE
jgi:hypothetical protein